MNSHRHQSPRRRLVARLIATALLASSLAACQPGYLRQWRGSIGGGKDGIAGAWQGTWRSEATGHTGKLKAIVEGGPELIHAHYWASWRGILSATFRSDHTLAPLPGRTPNLKLSGSHRMPQWVGGVYHYDGTLEPGKHLHADYRSDLDHGSFDLDWVKPQ